MKTDGFSHDALIRLACSLPSTPSIVEWGAALKRSLEELLPELDRVSINIDRLSRPQSQLRIATSVTAVHVHDSSSIREGDFLIRRDIRDAAYFRELSSASSYPTQDYHPPYCLNVMSDNHHYIGSVVAWKLKSGAQLGRAEIDKLERLRPFLTFAMISAVARYQAEHRLYRDAFWAMERIARMGRLSTREREVLICRFNGKSVAETSALLHISEATVRRHIRSIGERIARFQILQRKLVAVPIRSRR